MGIHFLCPNGHHLNVKKELAGKVGYCPKCRAKLLVPNLDEVSSKSQGSSVEDILSGKSNSKEQKAPDVRRAELAAESNVALDDQTALWYVRTLDGQSYGPAVGSVIKNWIEERRIGPKMLIWRQNWEKWEEAEKVFPEIRAIFESNESEQEPGAEDLLRSSVARLVDSRVSGRSDLASRKRKAVNSYYLILSLIGLIAILLIALIAILLVQ